jgi:hypothetical protein
MQPQPSPRAELVCRCGLTFEPLPGVDAELDEPVCDECADGE